MLAMAHWGELAPMMTTPCADSRPKLMKALPTEVTSSKYSRYDQNYIERDSKCEYTYVLHADLPMPNVVHLCQRTHSLVAARAGG